MTTDKQQIQQWLDRFMAGATTEQEERQLAEYFCTQADFPEEWAAYAVMFRGLQKSAVDEQKTSSIYIPGLTGGHCEAPSSSFKLRWWMAAAAVVMAVLGFGWLYGDLERQGETADAVSTAVTLAHSEPAVKMTEEASELTARTEEPTAVKRPKPKRQRRQETVVAAIPEAENSAAPLLNIDMTAVQQQGEDLRTALAIVNSEIFETE